MARLKQLNFNGQVDTELADGVAAVSFAMFFNHRHKRLIEQTDIASKTSCSCGELSNMMNIIQCPTDNPLIIYLVTGPLTTMAHTHQTPANLQCWTP
jgi:hypothetical protein